MLQTFLRLLSRRIRGLFSSNQFRRRVFFYMTFRGVIRQVRRLTW